MATTVAGVAEPGSPAATSAEVQARGCVSEAEYLKVTKGMAQSKVHTIFGTSGRLVSRDDLPDGQKLEARGYKACTSKRGAVGVSFTEKPGTSYKLAATAAEWR